MPSTAFLVQSYPLSSSGLNEPYTKTLFAESTGVIFGPESLAFSLSSVLFMVFLGFGTGALVPFEAYFGAAPNLVDEYDDFPDLLDMFDLPELLDCPEFVL